MFGSRGIFLAPEDGSPGGGSPAPSPGGDPTPAPAPAQNPAPAPSEVTFTPEQQAVINKLVGQARQEGRNAAKTPPAPSPAPAPQPVPAPPEKITIESLAQQLADTQLRARFDKRAAKRGLDDDAADDLFELYKVHKPTDDEHWFSEREKRLGLKQATATPATPPATSTTVTAPAQPAPSGPPLSDKGSPAPGGVVNWEREFAENPGFMSPAARAAMDAKYGIEKARRMRIDAVNAPGGQGERLRVTTK